MKKTRTSRAIGELSQLFFEVRQTIRAKLPYAVADPNEWMRCEMLRFIYENDGPTMQSIATYLRVKAPSATSLIRNLISLGWATRMTSESDKRVVRIFLTAAGKRELSRYRTRAQSTMVKVFSKLPKNDQTNLSRILRKVSDIHRI